MVLCMKTQQMVLYLWYTSSAINFKIIFLRRYLATHFREVRGHQRNMVLNRTFDVPYSGRKRPTQDAILRSVTMQIGGSGFRLKSFVINHCNIG